MSTQTAIEPATRRRGELPGQLGRFAAVGVASTLANLALFALFASVMPNQVANFVALLLCTVANTTANRRFTFAASDPTGPTHRAALAVQVRSLALLGVTWTATAGALWILHHLAPGSSTLVATLTVGVGNAVATVVRFVLLRRWFAA